MVEGGMKRRSKKQTALAILVSQKLNTRYVQERGKEDVKSAEVKSSLVWRNSLPQLILCDVRKLVSYLVGLQRQVDDGNRHGIS